MDSITIGAYNMSWLSGDSKNPLPPVPYSGPGWTEYAWLRYVYSSEPSIEKRIEVDQTIPIDEISVRCRYWFKALDNLKKFIIKKNPGFISLLEMNVNTTDTDADTVKNVYVDFDKNQQTGVPTTFKKDDATPWKTVDKSVGTNAISIMLQEVNRTTTTTNYKLLCGQVLSFGLWVGICIIYDETQVGMITHTMIVDNPSQAGRPLLMAYTNKNYLLAAMHGAQNPGFSKNENDEFNIDIRTKNQNFFKTKSLEFLGSINKTEEIEQVFLAGDFNDRYNAIQSIELELVNVPEIKFDGPAPRTAAPNWDSAGDLTTISDDKYFKTSDIEGITYYTNIKDPRDEAKKGMQLDLEHASSDNYLYSGDKVFGKTPIEDPTIKKFDDENEDAYIVIDGKRVSIASDHPLVYGIFGIVKDTKEETMENTGGRRSRRHNRRSKRRRTHKRRSNKKRRTHKRRKNKKTRR